MEERVDYLPLGSVVIVHGGVKKVCNRSKRTTAKDKWRLQTF